MKKVKRGVTTGGEGYLRLERDTILLVIPDNFEGTGIRAMWDT
jgi:hypothetical protein